MMNNIVFAGIRLKCSECHLSFSSATSMLVHYSEHVTQKLSGNSHKNEKTRKQIFSKSIPNSSGNSDYSTLTINCDNNNVPLNSNATYNVKEKDGSTNADNDDFNPVKFCSITMNDMEDNIIKDKSVTDYSLDLNLKKTKNNKKYVCLICYKRFGWPTDLKRHKLIHTGERPFKCLKCKAAFTRNFLLQKHLSKVHPCQPLKENMDIIQKQVDNNLKELKRQMCILKN